MGFGELLPRSPAKFCSGHHMSRVFPNHKNATFLRKCKNILAFPLREKTSVEVGQPSTRQNRKRRRGKFVDSDCSVWTETTKDKERICKENPVSGLCA
jgi:hypothetical protein